MKGTTIGIWLVLAVSMVGCTTSRTLRSPEVMAQVKNHQRIAVLPFQVTFSPLYLEELYRRRKREQTFEEFVWEHQRTAGLELQATFFKQVARQIEKNKMNIQCLDFLQTNRLLGDQGIPMIDLFRTPKEQIARALGVDAVVFGETSIDMDRRTPSWGGVSSKIYLYDSRQQTVVLTDVSEERFNRPMDTPAYLANNTVSTLARRLPY